MHYLTGCANFFRKGITNVGQFTLTRSSDGQTTRGRCGFAACNRGPANCTWLLLQCELVDVGIAFAEGLFAQARQILHVVVVDLLRLQSNRLDYVGLQAGRPYFEGPRIMRLRVIGSESP